MDLRMYGWIDVHKFSPVFYRTLSPLGPLPKKEQEFRFHIETFGYFGPKGRPKMTKNLAKIDY